MNTENKNCPECDDKIKGRADKKFCSDACRNAFNNKLNSDANSTVRNINNALRKIDGFSLFGKRIRICDD